MLMKRAMGRLYKPYQGCWRQITNYKEPRRRAAQIIAALFTTSSLGIANAFVVTKGPLLYMLLYAPLKLASHTLNWPTSRHDAMSATSFFYQEDLDKEEDKMMVEKKVDKEVEVEVKRERQINMRLGGHFNEVINWRWSGHYKDEATLDSQLPIQCRHITGRHLDN